MAKEPAPGRPKWIDQGGGFFSGDRGKAFYGVGVASNISSPSLQRSVAETQARADIARVFKSKIENLVKVYTRSISGGPGNRESPEQFAQETTRAFTSMELSGATVIDHYFDPRQKALYALAILDAEAFKTQLENLNELSEQTRQIIQENADKAFEELDQLEQQNR
jgi:hypothetical protein